MVVIRAWHAVHGAGGSPPQDRAARRGASCCRAGPGLDPSPSGSRRLDRSQHIREIALGPLAPALRQPVLDMAEMLARQGEGPVEVAGPKRGDDGGMLVDG